MLFVPHWRELQPMDIGSAGPWPETHGMKPGFVHRQAEISGYGTAEVNRLTVPGTLIEPELRNSEARDDARF
jgi:hypothetical protein